MKQLKSYWYLMRWHKPIGVWLLLWPTLWALWLASEGFPGWKLMSIFVLGVCLMRPAGCIINDIWDKDIDKVVPRTRYRPLATGDVSLKEAWLLFIVLCITAAQLLWCLPTICTQLAILALLLSSVYPLMKRWMPIPQLILGLAWYLSVPMAYGAVLGEVPAVGWWLYLASVMWTVAFDTMYAMADAPADKKLGLHSAALLLGGFTTMAIVLCLGGTLLLLAIIGFHYELGGFFYGGLFAALLCSGYEVWLVQQKYYIRAFRANQWLGFFVFAGIAISTCC